MARVVGPPARVIPVEAVDPLAPTDGPAVLTGANIDGIASVLADPATAWMLEPTERKLAHARRRGVAIPEEVDEEAVNVVLRKPRGPDSAGWPRC